MIKLVEFDSDSLIDFYIKNELEFDEKRKYIGTNVKSYALLRKGKVIGAISISVYKFKSFIEAVVVDDAYRRKGYGKILLEKAIKEAELPVYTISKNDKFYINNGFIYDEADLIGNECKVCSKFNITCFPKVMVYKKR